MKALLAAGLILGLGVATPVWANEQGEAATLRSMDCMAVNSLGRSKLQLSDSERDLVVVETASIFGASKLSLKVEEVKTAVETRHGKSSEISMMAVDEDSRIKEYFIRFFSEMSEAKEQKLYGVLGYNSELPKIEGEEDGEKVVILTHAEDGESEAELPEIAESVFVPVANISCVIELE